MAKPPLKVVLLFTDIGEEVRDGKYHFLANDQVFALGRWAGDRWVYPGNLPLDFVPLYSRSASNIVVPAKLGQAEERQDG